MILTVRTDKPEAELGLFDGPDKIAYDSWIAHRELGATLHTRLEVFLQATGTRWDDISGIVFYKGPGSFTGLRIGASVVNALAYSYSLPVVSESGDMWAQTGVQRLASGESTTAIPFYGSDAFTTKPKK